MVANTLNLIFRNFNRSKSTFVINILGLSIAFTASLFIYFWVSDELSVDKFHENDERLFQVVSNVTNNGNVLTREATPIGLADVLSRELPEVEFAATVTALNWFPKIIVKKNESKIKCEGKFVSQDFLQMFTYPLVIGDTQNALASKQSILLSASMARKFFGSPENAIGQGLNWEITDIKREGTITGIFQDVPANSTDQFDIVFPIEMLRDLMGFAKDDMNAFGPQTFITLPAETDLTTVNKKLDLLIKTKRPDLSNDSFYLVNYSSLYLYGNFENGIQHAGRMNYVSIFSIVALAVLFLACINFVNLTTAESQSRMKEVGVRKIIGASRWRLAFRNLAEAIVVCLVALAVALLTVSLTIPIVNDALEKQLSHLLNFQTISLAISVAMIIGVLAGIYPAFYLTRINPIAALKGNNSALTHKSLSRQVLVGFQFGISVLAIFFAIVIHTQISFVQNKSLGYKKENVLYFENEGEIAKDVNGFIASLKEVPGVVEASSMIGTFTGMAGTPQVLTIDNKQIPMHLSFINYDLIETMKMTVADGRSFNKELNDVNKIILNQKAVAALGISDPVGKIIPFGGQQMEVIGVVQDFHLNSLHQQIHPMMFQLETTRHWNIVVRIEETNQLQTLSRIEQHFHKFNPGLPFDYRFLEHELTKQYKAEGRIHWLSLSFSAIAIFISMLGLLSLAAFVCKRRIKEIGIRKVVGASEPQIMFLLSSFFLKLVLISMIVSLPIGFLLAQEWLNNFAYAIDIRVWMFVCTASGTVMLMIFTISGFVFQASRMNPATTLKNE